jgi:hypothetical protein
MRQKEKYCLATSITFSWAWQQRVGRNSLAKNEKRDPGHGDVGSSHVLQVAAGAARFLNALAFRRIVGARSCEIGFANAIPSNEAETTNCAI